VRNVRWQDWLAIGLGVWLLLSPWQLGHTLNHAATANACGVGIVVIVYDLISGGRLVEQGQEILNILLGAWLFLSPYALNFRDEIGATRNAMAVGIAIVVLAIWQIFDATRIRHK